MLNSTSHSAIVGASNNPKLVEIAVFLDQEEQALTDLLTDLGEFEAANAVGVAARLAAAPKPDLSALGDAPETILDGLESIPMAVVEHMMFAGLGPRDAHTAVRWAGARVTDLFGIIEAA